MRVRASFKSRIETLIGRCAGGATGPALALFVAGALGFIAGLYATRHAYDPQALPFVTATSIALACAATIVAFAIRHRQLRARLHALEHTLEQLADQNWELREAQERAKSLLAAQGDVIVRRDNSGRITFANDAFRALLAPGRDAPRIIEQGPVTVLPDGTRMHDQKITAAEGDHWIAWRDVAVRTDDGSEVQSVGRDVTARVETERRLAEARDAAEAASRAKSGFLAMVSHEIRTPLNGILGMAGLLLDTRLTPEQITYVKAAKTSGETLLSLIEEVLDFSKIEAGKLDLDPRPFSLTALVEDVTELLAPRAQAKGIEIASFLDECLPQEVVADAARLRQVLLNLAGNAVKFTETGGVAIIVEPDTRPGAGTDDVAIMVRDTGIGLSPADQARVFGEFEQADTGPARKFGGTGLGLAICKRILARMDGRLEVDSSLGAGATFTAFLRLPRAPGSGGSPRTPPDLTHTAMLIAAPATIEATLLARRLQKWGAQCCIVTDADAAMRALAQQRWDAVLVDHALAAIAAPAIEAAARCIALITPAQRDDLAALRNAGFDSYLIKPVRAASLAARLAPDASVPQAPGGADRSFGAPPAPEPQRPLSILVAEDNEINAMVASALLAQSGHRTAIAGDGDAAVAMWRAGAEAGTPFDLILMDVHMPGADGLEATQRIRRAEQTADRRRTPIVALTASTFEEDRAACIAAGMDALLVKPLDRDDLAGTLAAISGRHGTLAA